MKQIRKAVGKQTSQCANVNANHFIIIIPFLLINIQLTTNDDVDNSGCVIVKKKYEYFINSST